MSETPFTLIPFDNRSILDISLSGSFALENRILSLHYRLAGDLEAVSLPPAAPTPGRKDELWKATCFEFFLAIHTQPEYWEFNMSPSGDWNVYRMDAYRRIGFREEKEILKLPFVCKRKPDNFVLDVSVDVSAIFRIEQPLQMGITAIVRAKDGRETYWALAHPAAHADFHQRDSFILPLAGQTHPLGQSARDG